MLRPRTSKSKLDNLLKLTVLAVVVGLTSLSSVKADLANGSFEDPDTGPLPTARYLPQGLVPLWQTTAPSGNIEIWSNSFTGIAAADGKQHAELNADQVGMLYQDVAGINAGSHVGFEFAHRARVGNDVLRLTITDLGVDNATGGGNDTVLFSKTYSATAATWSVHTSLGEPVITALGNNIRFAYEAVSTGSGDLTRGNFIDAAKFGAGVAVPEPSAATVICLCAAAVVFRRNRRRRSESNESVSPRFDESVQ